jgi:ubiquinone biosynthesis protein
MERVDGLRVDDAPGLAAAGVAPERVARTLVEAYAEQILAHGFFHADPHPGNLRVLADGRVALLDFGLAKELPDGFRRAVLALAAAVLAQEREALARALGELGFATRDGGAEGLLAIADVWLGVARELRAQGRLTPEAVLRLREELPEALRRHPLVRVPAHLVLLGRALALLSGTITALGAKLEPASFLAFGAGLARP